MDSYSNDNVKMGQISRYPHYPAVRQIIFLVTSHDISFHDIPITM